MSFYRLLSSTRVLMPVIFCSSCLSLYAQGGAPRGGQMGGPNPGAREMFMNMSEAQRADFRSKMESLSPDERREYVQKQVASGGFGGAPGGVRTSSAALESQRTSRGPSSEVAVNWENITLKDCIETLCRDLEMEFIISPSVNVAQEVSVRAGDITAWKRENKLEMFDAILETAGVQRIQQGRVWVFSPSKLRPVLSADSESDLSGGTPVIGVLKVQNISAQGAANILNQIDGKPQRVFPQQNSNVLLVSGTRDFLAQTQSLLEMIDIPPAVLTHFMIENADASDLADELNMLFSRRAGGDGSAIQFIPIARLNMIVAHNAPASIHAEIANWVKILDSADGANERVTKVYHIQVIDAETIAKTLNSLYSDLHKQAVEKEKKYGATKTPQTATSGAKKSGSTAKAAPKAAAPKTVSSNASATSGATMNYAEEEVIILADKDTNTIIVNAPLEAHREVEKTLDELDRAREQVLIETVLVEVTLDESTEFGVEWAAQELGIGGLSGTGAQITGAGGGMSGLDPTLMLTNATAGFTYLLGNSDNMLAMIHAAQNDDRLQVLSSPTVLTRDGMEAEISFGEEVPVKQTSITDGGRENVSYDYRDAKIALKVTPHIDDNRMVTLAMEQELKHVDEDATSEAPTFRTRELKTSLQVFDQQTLVLGGLIQREDVDRRVGIPILSQIPLIKYLFSRTITSKRGSEIMMILTPRVIENVSQADSLTKEYRRKVLGSMQVEDIRAIYGLVDEEEAAAEKELSDQEKKSADEEK